MRHNSTEKHLHNLRHSYRRKTLAFIFAFFTIVSIHAQDYKAFANVPQVKADITHVFDPICKQA